MATMDQTSGEVSRWPAASAKGGRIVGRNADERERNLEGVFEIHYLPYRGRQLDKGAATAA